MAETMAENLKNLPNGTNTTTSGKRLATEYGTDVTSSKGIADHFNNFFLNIGVTLASKSSTDTSKINPTLRFFQGRKICIC